LRRNRAGSPVLLRCNSVTGAPTHNLEVAVKGARCRTGYDRRPNCSDAILRATDTPLQRWCTLTGTTLHRKAVILALAGGHRKSRLNGDASAPIRPLGHGPTELVGTVWTGDRVLPLQRPLTLVRREKRRAFGRRLWAHVRTALRGSSQSKLWKGAHIRTASGRRGRGCEDWCRL